MFFNIIDTYGVSDVPGIYNTVWHKNKNVIFTNDAIILGK